MGTPPARETDLDFVERVAGIAPSRQAGGILTPTFHLRDRRNLHRSTKSPLSDSRILSRESFQSVVLVSSAAFSALRIPHLLLTLPSRGRTADLRGRCPHPEVP